MSSEEEASDSFERLATGFRLQRESIETRHNRRQARSPSPTVPPPAPVGTESESGSPQSVGEEDESSAPGEATRRKRAQRRTVGPTRAEMGLGRHRPYSAHDLAGNAFPIRDWENLNFCPDGSLDRRARTDRPPLHPGERVAGHPEPVPGGLLKATWPALPSEPIPESPSFPHLRAFFWNDTADSQRRGNPRALIPPFAPAVRVDAADTDRVLYDYRVFSSNERLAPDAWTRFFPCGSDAVDKLNRFLVYFAAHPTCVSELKHLYLEQRQMLDEIKRAYVERPDADFRAMMDRVPRGAQYLLSFKSFRWASPFVIAVCTLLLSRGLDIIEYRPPPDQMPALGKMARDPNRREGIIAIDMGAPRLTTFLSFSTEDRCRPGTRVDAGFQYWEHCYHAFGVPCASRYSGAEPYFSQAVAVGLRVRISPYVPIEAPRGFVYDPSDSLEFFEEPSYAHTLVRYRMHNPKGAVILNWEQPSRNARVKAMLMNVRRNDDRRAAGPPREGRQEAHPPHEHEPFLVRRAKRRQRSRSAMRCDIEPNPHIVWEMANPEEAQRYQRTKKYHPTNYALEDIAMGRVRTRE